MKKYLIYYLFITLSIFLNSCNEGFKEEYIKIYTESSTQMGGSIQGVELDLSTAVTTLAGSSLGSTDATGTSARFYAPRGITTDGMNLYAVDQLNHRIRKIE